MPSTPAPRIGFHRLVSAALLLALAGVSSAQQSAPPGGDAGNGGGSGRITIELSGQGAVRTIGNLAFDPGRVTTGLVEIGEVRTVPVVLEHTGPSSSAPISIDAVAIVGKSADEYATTLEGGITLRPGDARSFELVFSPRRPGPKSASLRVRVDDNGAPMILFIEGEARYPLVSELSPNVPDLAFGQVVTGSTASKTLVLTNTGDAGAPPVSLVSAALSGDTPGAFAVDFAPGSLAPGESLELSVIMGPAAPGTKGAALEIEHDGNNPALRIALSGQIVAPSAVPVAFGVGTLQTPGYQVDQGTVIQFGPDGRLYVGEKSGLIHAFDVSREGPSAYVAAISETIDAVEKVANHDDDGVPNPAVTGRQMTGMHVTGTPSAIEIYASSSDPRIGGQGAGDTGLDTNSGMLHRLAKGPGGWTREDLVRGLPRSEENHGVNGLVKAGQTVYLIVGGHTNNGVPSDYFGATPEYALAAALIAIDLDAIGSGPYDLPTLDDEDRPGDPDANDPFGGNDGKNQAKLVAGGPVTLHSTGLRNAYDLVLTETGKLYTFDNGPNGGLGAAPGAGCGNGYADGGPGFFDSLHLLTSGSHAGHPNPTRGNTANTFNASNPQSPVETESNPIECTLVAPDEDGSLTVIGASTNGLDEYTASNFAGAMKGDLVAISWNSDLWRVELGPGGDTVTSKSVLANLKFANNAAMLDVTAQGDGGPFPGTLWVLPHFGGEIKVLEPDDYGLPSGP